MSFKHKIALIPFLIVLSLATKITSALQNRLCFKEGSLNDFTKEFFTAQAWEIEFIESEKQINSELKNSKCTMVEFIKYFKSKSIMEKPIFLYSFPAQVHQHFSANYRYYVKNLDRENHFKNIKSLDFLPQEWYQEYKTIKNQQGKREEFSLKSFVFVGNSQPFLVYGEQGFLETSSMKTYDLQKLKEILKDGNAPFSYEEVMKKVEEMITYTMISNYQKFQQNVKFFTNFEFSIKFDKITWQPIISKIRHVNIMQSNLYTQQDRVEQTPKYKFLLSHLQQVYTFELGIIDNFKSFSNIKSQVATYNTDYLNLKLLINQETDFFGPLEAHKISTASEIFPKKFWLCLHNMGSKVRPVKKWVARHKPNWIIFDDIRKYKFNIQNCDIAYTLERFPYSQLDFKTQVWNKFKEYKLMHNKGNFYKLLRSYDLKDKYTFNSTYFFPESYLLEYDNPKMTYDEKAFMKKVQQPGEIKQWIYKPVYSSRGRGISIFDTLEEAQKNYQENKKIIKSQDSSPSSRMSTQKQQNQYLLQKYIKDTQTLENRKFDIRCYLVFAWSEPGAELVLFNSGKVRRSLHDYVEDGEDANSNDQLSQHLTNIALSKKEYKKDLDIHRNQTMSTIQQFKDHLEDVQGLSKQKLDEIFFEMKKIVAYTAEAFLNKIPKQPGHFETYGMDIMFDKNWKPFILEANTSPMFNTKDYNEGLKAQVYEILGSVMDLETFLVENKSKAKQLIKEQTQLPLGHLEVLFNRANGFSILNEFKKDKQQQHENLDLEKEMNIKFDEVDEENDNKDVQKENDDLVQNEIDTDELYSNDCPQLDQNCEKQIIIDNKVYTEYCESIY